MSVSDLTNTTWVFNESQTWTTDLNYDINFTSNNTQYTKLYVYYDDALDYYYYNSSVGYYNVYHYSWINQEYRTIHITGGTAVTNTTLINWLQAHATQQLPTTPKTMFGNLPIITKHFGNLEVIKEVLNGVVVYQNAPSVVYPTISDIIFVDLDGNGKKPYRVLKNVSGTTYEIMSMDDGIITAQRYSSSSQNYSGSEIDTRLKCNILWHTYSNC